MTGLILVRDVMTESPRVVRRDTSIQEVVATMNKFDISSVIVVEEKRPVGIITHRDIISKVNIKSPSAAYSTRSRQSLGSNVCANYNYKRRCKHGRSSWTYGTEEY